MDKLAIEAAEQYAHAGYPVGAEAILLVELDGCASEVEHLVGVTDAILRVYEGALRERRPTARP